MRLRKRRSIWALLAVISTPFVFPSGAFAIGEFDTGLEGWTSDGGTLTHVPSGGNPGGFLQLTDETSSNMFVTAPLADSIYSGNLSGYVNGFVQFDARLVGLSGPATPFTTFGTITFSGGGKSASLDVAPLGEPGDQWTTYWESLTALAWGIDSNDWDDILGNVTSITVNLESNSPIVETVGFDNFRLKGLPEPSSATLLLVAMTALTAIRRRMA